MGESKYIQNFDDFLARHPEISTEWGDFMKPLIQGTEDEMFAFIMSYVFM
ncbi:MAG: hypothetical protein LBT26_10550 [Clostridiales Family XIII bacterium]|jgi:hypothetical protein|nr:hypothetical protein [Clostridiales Family XIII bacterium]